MKIRIANLKDFDQIILIETSSFGKDSFTPSAVKRHLDSSNFIFLVMEENEEILGYITLYERNDTNCLRIYNLAVKESARGRGIGNQLVDHAIKSCTPVRYSRILLEVKKGNTAAIALYQNKGFQVIKEIKGYYYGNKTALQMELEIKG